MFSVYSTDDHRTVVHELMPCTAMVHQVGQAMVMSGGKLTLATGTKKPEFICNQQAKTACEAGEMVAVTRVAGDIVYQTTIAAAGASLKVGDKVTIHTDGEQVTATTDGGVAQIVRMGGTAAGDPVWVRFN